MGFAKKALIDAEGFGQPEHHRRAVDATVDHLSKRACRRFSTIWPCGWIFTQPPNPMFLLIAVPRSPISRTNTKRVFEALRVRRSSGLSYH